MLAICIFSATAANANPSVRKGVWGPAHLANGKSALPTYRELRVGLYSTSISWRMAARTRPSDPTDPDDAVYRWPKSIVADVAAATAAGMQVSIGIKYSPPWASASRKSRFCAPEDPGDYARFLVAASRRFPSVHLWQVWGEPSRNRSFIACVAAGPTSYLVPDPASTRLNATQATAPQAYARLVEATYKALKAENRRNLIIGGSTYTGGDIRTLLWIRYMRLPNGKPPRMDLYGHNPFPLRKPDLSNRPSTNGRYDFSDLRRLETVVTKYLGTPHHKTRIPLFLAEFCIPTGPDREFNGHVSLATQASWIKSALAITRSRRDNFIHSMSWIHLQDNQFSSCGLIDAKGQPKPGYWQFRSG